MKIILFILFICVCLLIVGVIFINNKNYKLVLPETEKVKSIAIEKDKKIKEISDVKEIQDIIYVINNSGKGRNTKQKSINDFPVNAINIIRINFNFLENEASTLFVYIKDDNYYIEKPYDGIYKISGDVYNSIEKYAKNNDDNYVSNNKTDTNNDVNIDELEQIAKKYYDNTVWKVVSMKVKSVEKNKVVFEVVSKKDGILVEPNRSITVKKVNGKWKVTGEGY